MDNNFIANQFPWEDENLDFVQRSFQTIKAVLIQPAEVFKTINNQTGIGKSLLFGVIFGSIGSLAAYLYQIVFRIGMFSMMGNMGNMGKTELLTGAIALPILLLIMVVLIPIMSLIGIFISSGIFHLMLLIFKGANNGFETTVKVVAYTFGSTAVINIIPFCGGIIAGVWGLVCYIIGLKTAHDTDTWKAVLSVLAPIILICCCCAAVMIFAIATPAFMQGFYQGYHGQM